MAGEDGLAIVALQGLPAGGLIDVEHRPAVVQGEGDGHPEGVLPGGVGRGLLGKALQLQGEDILHQCVDVLIVIVKGIAGDLAALGDVADGDLVKGTLRQQLHKALADGILRALRHGGPPCFRLWAVLFFSRQ